MSYFHKKNKVINTKTDFNIFLTIILILFSKRSEVLLKFALIMKENQILLRTLEKGEIIANTNDKDRWFIAQLIIINRKIQKYLTIVKPETVLKKWTKIQQKRYMENIPKIPLGIPFLL